MSRVKHGAGKLLGSEEGFDRSYGLALFGDAGWKKQEELALRIVGRFEQAARFPDKAKQPILNAATRQLNPLLEQAFAKLPRSQPFDTFKSAVRRCVLDALSRLDPRPLQDLASAIEASHRVRDTGPVHPLQTMILRLVERLAFERGEIEPVASKGQLPHTSKDFTDRLNAEFKTCYSEPHVRKAATSLGYRFQAGKPGQPRKPKQ